MRTLTLFLVLAGLGLVSGCASDPPRARRDAGSSPPPGDGGAPIAGDAGAPIDEPDGGDPFASLDRARDPACPGEWVAGIAGRVLDEAGRPLAGAMAQPCMAIAGSDRRLCLEPGATNAQGRFAIEVIGEARCVDEVAMRVIVPRAARSSAYCPIALEPEDGVLAIGGAFTLFETLAPSARGASTRWDGAELEVVAESLDEGAFDRLSARVLDGSELARMCPGGDHAGFDLALTFAPEGPVYDTGAGFRITRAMPGDRYEVLVLGGVGTQLLDGTLVPEAVWARFGTARRGSDGAVVPEAGTRIPHLSTIALRRM